jgi:hypothetical protein
MIKKNLNLARLPIPPRGHIDHQHFAEAPHLGVPNPIRRAVAVRPSHTQPRMRQT